MSSQEPPPFQEAARCDVCKCSFNTFRRRHHCRCCGRTLCSEHSSNQMVLPQFGLHSYVRVCLDCFNNSSSGRKVDQQASIDEANGNGDGQTFEDRIDVATDKVSRLDITADPDMKTDLTVEQHHPVLECKCGMPLCICVPPEPSKDVAASQTISRPISTANLSTKPKRKDTSPKNRASASNIKHNSSLFSLGRVTNNNSDGSQMEYEVNGEGLREAIKNSDAAAVKELLRKGVDANYCDKQGLSLLHLAALFNKTEIAFVLMDSGARLDCKNVQGETPVDCAPATLQYKMRKKAEEEGSMGQT